MSRRISTVGLGKLGASMAAIASRGHAGIGVDVNQETELQTLIEQNGERLCATMSHEEAIRDSELTFVIVPTPSDERGAALRLDSRIGRRYLTGGLDFGGPCFPRDNVALAFIALGVRADLDAADFVRPDTTVTVVDSWRILSAKRSNVPGHEYLPYGCGDPTSDAGALAALWGETLLHYGDS